MEKSHSMKDTNMMRTLAQTKKERLTKIDREKKAAPPGLSLEQRQRAEGLLPKAQQLLDEQEDDVKGMNQDVMLSKVLTIRDKQLEENKQLERDYLDEQKRLDLMMEIERLKQIKEDDERERRRVEARKVGAQVIVGQIYDRHQMRIREMEEKEKEQILMRQQVEQMRLDEERKVKEKQERGRKMLIEVEAANKMAIALKDKKIQQERDED